ncbi:skin secretory protein xP2-like [Prinia subflava]|uniref:skin secretory protein xP2-like n=1 Tax=Prinia subflava TaxID=208062 RepID=UPI002FDFB7C9
MVLITPKWLRQPHIPPALPRRGSGVSRGAVGLLLQRVPAARARPGAAPLHRPARQDQHGPRCQRGKAPAWPRQRSGPGPAGSCCGAGQSQSEQTRGPGPAAARARAPGPGEAARRTGAPPPAWWQQQLEGPRTLSIEPEQPTPLDSSEKKPNPKAKVNL